MRRLLFAFALLLAAAAGTGAQAQLREVREVEGITEYALPNGLTVLLQPDASRSTTSVNITYRVGTRHEGAGETGAAHLLEHMLFKASETVADPKLEMTRRGARWNGTTWHDRTNYFAQFASSDETLEWMLGWLAESMTRALLQPAELATEMTVVRNELERAENNPARVLGSRMRAAAYQWHGYGHDVLGARSDVEHIPIERLRAFYRTHYRPDNAVLVIGGRFDPALARRRVEAAFGTIPRPALPLPATYTREPVQDGEREVVLRRVGGSAQVALLYHAMPAAHPDFAAMRVLSQLLAAERGPLARSLVDPGLAAQPWAYLLPGLEPGYLVAGVTLREAAADAADGEARARKAVAEMARVMENLQATPAQVEAARAQQLQAMQAQLRDPEALSLGISEAVAVGDWRMLFQMRDWLEAVKPEDVNRVAREWLVPANRTAGLYLPEAATPRRAPLAQVGDVPAMLAQYRGRTAVASVEDFALTPQNIEARLVKSRLQVGGRPGLSVVVLPRKAKDERVTGILRLRWGSVEGVQGQAVAATLIGPLLLQGGGTLDAEGVRKRLLDLEAQLRLNTAAGGLTATFEVPAARLQPFIELMAVLLRQPDFADDAFDRVRATALANNRAALADTRAVAAVALQRGFSSAYAPGDPRAARSLEETGQLLQAATAAQLRSFWQRFGGAGHGELALAGPVQPAEVHGWLQRALGDWRSAEPHRPWIFEYPKDTPARWEALKMPDKANASYAARIPLAITEDSPDYPALFAAVQLLGGRAGTALWQRVREQEGLSYGVRASLYAPISVREDGQAGAINIQASFAPENRERLRHAIRDELALRAKEGFSSLHVGFARRAIVSGRADWLAQPANLVSLLATNLRWGRDMQLYQRHTEAYENLDTAAVNAAIAKYLDLQRMAEVAAGSFGP